MVQISMIYKIRRKLQVFAQKIFPDEILSKLYYRIVFKKKLRLNCPETLNEKLQWYKLNYCPYDPLVIKGADKYAVREYVKDKGLGIYLNNLIDTWDDPNEIEWEELPDQFVLKANHGCGYNILCSDKANFDINLATKLLSNWLKEDFGVFNIEPHYSKIMPKKIICESYLGDIIVDYKFFCFHGVPHFFYVTDESSHDEENKMGYFDMDGTNLPLTREGYEVITKIEIPKFYDEMVEAVKILCQDFPFVRVDFFIANNQFYFAELTFTPSAAMMPISPNAYDLKWGSLLNIDRIIKL